jgi:hypothetical protein
MLLNLWRSWIRYDLRLLAAGWANRSTSLPYIVYIAI